MSKLWDLWSVRFWFNNLHDHAWSWAFREKVEKRIFKAQERIKSQDIQLHEKSAEIVRLNDMIGKLSEKKRPKKK
jgi:hypothetical protein